jgi:hypothetical protein
MIGETFPHQAFAHGATTRIAGAHDQDVDFTHSFQRLFVDHSSADDFDLIINYLNHGRLLGKTTNPRVNYHVEFIANCGKEFIGGCRGFGFMRAGVCHY